MKGYMNQAKNLQDLDQYLKVVFKPMRRKTLEDWRTGFQDLHYFSLGLLSGAPQYFLDKKVEDEIISKTQTTETTAEALVVRLRNIIYDIKKYMDSTEETESAFFYEVYEKWLEGADGMLAILALEHLIEEKDE